MIEVTNFILMRGKFHFTLNYIVHPPYSSPPHVCGFGASKVEAEVSGWEDPGWGLWGQADWIERPG